MELSLLHEDIYVYIDPIVERTDLANGTNVSFVNDSQKSIADNGVFNITVSSGSFSKMVISCGDKTLTINTSMPTGTAMILNFRDNVFMKNGALFFLEDIIELKDDDYHVWNITLTGSGSAAFKYTFESTEENPYDDLMFLQSISSDTNLERSKKTLFNGKEITLKNAKKVHSFSINGLWNQDEVSKFTEKFRMRLVDGDGNELETLAGCTVNSNGVSSSSDGDLTYAISGSCEKIF